MCGCLLVRLLAWLCCVFVCVCVLVCLFVFVCLCLFVCVIDCLV